MKFTHNIRVELMSKPVDSLTPLIDRLPDLIKPSIEKPMLLLVTFEENDPNLTNLYETLKSCGIENLKFVKNSDFDKNRLYYKVEKRATIEESDIESAEYLEFNPSSIYSINGTFEKLEKNDGCICIEKKYSGKFRHTQRKTGRRNILVKDIIKEKLENSNLIGHKFKPVYLKSKSGIEKSIDIWELTSHLILSSIDGWESCDFFPTLFQINRSDLINFGECDIMTQIDTSPYSGSQKFEPIIVSKKFYNFWNENSFEKIEWSPIFVKEDV